MGEWQYSGGEAAQTTQACGGLIRHPRWQGSLGWTG